jgi:hypothetical protein
MTGGPKALPIIEFEDGGLLRDSSVIAERARNGTLIPTPAPAAAPQEPPPASDETL